MELTGGNMKIAVLGTGAYGMALATALKRKNNQITMWTNFTSEKEKLEQERGNEKVLPGIILDKEIEITCDMKQACTEKELIILAIPIAHLETTIIKVKDFIEEQTALCIATKGIEEYGHFAHELLKKHIESEKVAVLSGPTFALDLATDTVCALTIASKNKKVQKIMTNALETDHILLEECDDIIGVELCGSIKNIIAIASGILNGLGQSASTSALLQKKSLEEMTNIIESFQGERKTALTFAGIGDFILTCNSLKSRNYTYGTKVGSKDKDLEKYVESTTIEGLYTVKSLVSLLKKQNIKSPIIEKIHNICVKGEEPANLLTILVEKEK